MLIHPDWEEGLWAYIAGIARNHDIHPVLIGGIENHIHAVVEPPKSMHLPELMQILKTPSSGWINRSNRTREKFHWQDGYGAFSVSPSLLPRLTQYVYNQCDHHWHRTFEDEYSELVRSHKIPCDEACLLG